jgi:CDP-4-dehydro-6-deoxyglucose reductase
MTGFAELPVSDEGLVITLFPTGHAFRAEPRETILEAGLRAGFNLNHSCATGTCGSCRARLVAGQVALSQPHDFTFSAAERAAGWFLMCRNRAVRDLLVEAAEHDTPAAIPEQRINARVARLERLQEEVVLLQVRTPRSGGLRFLAGQSASLCFEGMAPVELPIASCPCDTLHLRFHLRRRPEDAFSDFVFDRLQKGHPLALCGPRGDFTLDESSERPLLFVAWESGFARVQGLIDHALQLNPERQIHLYWLSSIPSGHYLSNYCRAWVDALDDFHYHSIDLSPHGATTPGRVFEDIASGHGSLQQWDAYLVLPPELLARARAAFAAAGMPTEQLRGTVQDRP